MRLERFLDAIAADAIQTALSVTAPAVLRPTQDAALADFQVNGALPLAKQLKKNPKDLAALIAERLRAHPALASAEVSGAGFVNLRLAPAWIAEQLMSARRDTARDGVPAADAREKVVVDYSSPNVAKQMHVGHLRSTIIGDTIVRLLRFAGHDVIGDNHLGDWGTQFGLLIVGMRAFGSDDALAKDPIVELERVYREANARAEADPAFKDEARNELAKLQAGDPANRALWERFVAVSRAALDKIYDRLGVRFDEWLGESAYNDKLPGVVDTLMQKGLAREDQGAIGVFFQDLPDAPAEVKRHKEPYLVRKKDGAYLYATTDIAAVFDRVARHAADRIVYVVDARQSLHFQQLFAVVRMLGVTAKLDHVGFGTVLGPDGKPLKARAGNPVTLASLLDEAEERAEQRINEMRATGELRVAEADIPMVKRAVGIGAVKWADLRQNRLTDYQFDPDKMVAFKGNAGPYIQYAYARIQSIFRKGAIDPAALTSANIALDAPEEIALGKQLLRFADAVHAATEGFLPNHLCDHLFALASVFSTFYSQCDVLDSEGAVRESRLALCALTARQLRRGLDLLGIAVVDQM